MGFARQEYRRGVPLPSPYLLKRILSVYHFMANRWGNKAVRDYFLGLQNHYRWWLQPWKDGEAWRAAIHGVAKSRTRLSDWTTTKYMAKQRLKEFGEQTPLQSKQWKETIVLCRVMISAVAQLCATLSDPMVCTHRVQKTVLYISVSFANAYIWNLERCNNNPVYETAKELFFKMSVS